MMYRRFLVDPGASFWTSLRYFCVTRLVIAAVLLGASLYGGERIVLGDMEPALFARTVIAYSIFAAMFAYLAATRQRHFYLQLNVQLLMDVAALTILISASGGAKSGLALLFLLPVAGSAILSPAMLAIGFAALCSLAILLEAVWREIFTDAGSANILLAGLFGIAFFAIAIVLNRLAARLIVQERIARQRGYDLRGQIEINRLVVADMQDGVLILAADGTPRAANPAALRMLALDDARALVLDGWRGHPAGTTISRHFVAWRESAGRIGGTLDIAVSDRDVEEPALEHDKGKPLAEANGKPAAEATVDAATQATNRTPIDAVPPSSADSDDAFGRRLRVRFVAPESEASVSGRYVVFLEDMRRVEERAQQLKLAAMGRLTASIAHEIRNPLAAISHAGALLEEETSDQPGLPFGTRDMAGPQRMVSIVRENAQRLNRIVEEILQLSRRAPVKGETIALEAWLHELVDDFCQTHDCAREVVEVSVYARPLLRFNGEHLRQVLVNLLQNGVRYASGKPGSVVLIAVPVGYARPRRGDAAPSASRNEDVHTAHERIELIVQNDGPGIDRATRANMFEPFFTTHHRGTGLGLYLARELCLANGATLVYASNADRSKRGGFVINAAGALR